MKNIIIACFLSLPLFSIAQQQQQRTQTKKIVIHSILQSGLTAAKSDAGFQIQSINGIQYKTWLLGAGMGLDNSYPCSFPAFAEIRKDIRNRPSTVFVYADIGSQILAHKKYATDMGFGSYRTGLYYNIGGGYKLSIAKKFALLFSSGYSVKEYNYQTHIIYPCYSMGPCPEQINNSKFVLKRLSLQVGFMF